MVRHTDARGLKADAFALSKALAQYKVKLSHQQCLDVLAKAGGHRSYEAMAADTKSMPGEQPASVLPCVQVFKDMRNRVENWAFERGKNMEPPSGLLGSAERLIYDLKRKVKTAVDESIGDVKGCLWLLGSGDAIEVIGIRADHERVSGNLILPMVKTIDVCIEVDGEAVRSREEALEEVCLRLYKAFIQVVERVAKGYLICMESVVDGKPFWQEPDRPKPADWEEWSIQWRFFETDGSEDWKIGEHMTISDSHIIRTTGILSALIDREKKKVECVIGLWHVPIEAIAGVRRDELTRAAIATSFWGVVPAYSGRVVAERGGPVFDWRCADYELDRCDVKGLGGLMWAMKVACDGAVLMEGDGPHGEVQLDNVRIEGGLVVAEARHDYDIRSAREELSEGVTESLRMVVEDGVRRGLVRIEGRIRSGASDETFVPETVFRNGFAIMLS
jgi:hypothetical protein